MNKDLIPLYVGLIAAFVTAIGWIITNYLAKQKEDRVRQLEGTKTTLNGKLKNFTARYSTSFIKSSSVIMCSMKFFTQKIQKVIQ
jgi:hypothetical protein